ncbi:amidohydrolase family protein [Luteimonas composti]|uniref:Amidohydrolase family protein n=1 Tax=Luteimonas composti TaxID=398257 RepID=A0ABT6MLK8_9GAMM|nr:amidohydrolase family protein [Luteimonas composti]MDH7451522.1 amidohydrolase family protein [Luteimonas composti]
MRWIRARKWMVAALLAATPPLAHAGALAIVNARILPAPDVAPIERGTLLIRDGRIHALGASIELPEGVARIDAQGATAVAGYWNSHVHFIAPPLSEAASRPAGELGEALSAQYLRWGFTTVFDLASMSGNAIALRRRIEAGELAGPAILTVDAPFYPEGGTPIYVLEFEGMGEAARADEVATPVQAGERARRQLAQGADGAKIFAGAIVGGDTGVLPMPVPVARAVSDATHAAGKPVFAHPTNLEGLRAALDGGADVLTHPAPHVGTWPQDLLRDMLSRKIALVPTLRLFEIELDKDGAPPAVKAEVIGIAQRQVADYAAAGGELLFGTDSGYIDWYDTRDELRMMGEAGLDWRQILASLTTAPARRFGSGDRQGRLAPGQAADVVLLDADPREDVAGFAAVRAVYRDGRRVYPPAGAD